MAGKQLPLLVFIALCGLCAVQAAYYHPRLPEQVASHFTLSGRPDALSTKDFFFTLYYIASGGCAVLFLGMHFGISNLPAPFINLPNKDYWLSGERRQQTHAFLSHWLLWFGSATMLFLLDTFNQSFQVHLGKTEALPHPLLSLGLYTGFTVLWCIGLYRRFDRSQ